MISRVFLLALTTLSQNTSLWAIRISMILLAAGYWLQIRNSRRNTPQIVVLWVLGATLATYHVISALISFHQGSHAIAMASTAQRTEDLFGIQIGYGIYANYAFVAVWWFDALVRAGWVKRTPRWLEVATDGFLIAMAIFGSIVFAAGPIRYVGLTCVGIGIGLWLKAKENATKAP